jgi:hypothetical protein
MVHFQLIAHSLYSTSHLVNDQALFPLTFHHRGTYFWSNSKERPPSLNGDQMIGFLHWVHQSVLIKRTDTTKIDHLGNRVMTDLLDSNNSFYIHARITVCYCTLVSACDLRDWVILYQSETILASSVFQDCFRSRPQTTVRGSLEWIELPSIKNARVYSLRNIRNIRVERRSLTSQLTLWALCSSSAASKHRPTKRECATRVISLPGIKHSKDVDV